MFDPYHKWLGIPTTERPPCHYRLLGVAQFEKDLDVIEGAADKQMGFVRQYQSGEHAADAARILNELALARLCLLKPAKKTEYDAKLRKKLAVAAKPDPEATFADMPLPEIPSSSMLPARKRKSRKSNSGGIPPVLIGVAVAIVIVVVVIQFIPRRSNNVPNSDLASATDVVSTPAQPAAQPVVPPQPQQIAVAQNDALAPPASPDPNQNSDEPNPFISKSKPGAATQQGTSESMKPAEPKPKSKSTKSMVDPNEPVQVENEIVGANDGMAARIDLKGQTMVGIDWSPGEWGGVPGFKDFIPLAAGAPPNPFCNRVLAPKGYAIGAIKVIAPRFFCSTQLIYMKINDDGSLDPSDTKLSKWIGVKPKGEITTLSGEGKRLVGFQYRRVLLVHAIGIIVEP